MGRYALSTVLENIAKNGFPHQPLFKFGRIEHGIMSFYMTAYLGVTDSFSSRPEILKYEGGDGFEWPTLEVQNLAPVLV